MIKFEKSVRIRPTLKPRGGLSFTVPFLNVLLLLVMFFMLDKGSARISGVSVELPRANAGDRYSVSKFQNHFITVTEKGVIYFNDKTLDDLDALKTELSNAMNSRDTIVIRADASTPLQTLVRIVTIARERALNVIVMTSPSHEKPLNITDRE